MSRTTSSGINSTDGSNAVFLVTSLDKAMAAVEAALEKKAYDLVVLQTPHLDSIADYFLIATGRSDVQVLSIEGVNHAHWIVLDFNDVVAHIFFEPVREFYRLETNWTDARVVPLPEPLRSQADELKLRATG